MRTSNLCLAACALAAAVAVPSAAQAQGAFATLFGSPVSSGCWTRSYESSHLKAHPRQRVTSIVIAYRPVMQSKQKSTARKFEVGIGIRVKGDRELYARVAYCAPAGQGFACHLESDGGRITLAADGAQALRLTTTSIRIEGSKRFIEVGGAVSDDSTFVMRAAPASACAMLRGALD